MSMKELVMKDIPSRSSMCLVPHEHTLLKLEETIYAALCFCMAISFATALALRRSAAVCSSRMRGVLYAILGLLFLVLEMRRGTARR